MKTEITMSVVRCVGPVSLGAMIWREDPAHEMWDRVHISRTFQCPSTVVDCLPSLKGVSEASFAEVA